ncbi:MAG: AAA family ATPase [Thermoplasmatota archaeon]
MRAVAFTGMPGAGKSEAVESARAAGIPVVRMGDAVWEEVRRRGLPIVDENVGKVATEMRQTHGRGIWAVRTLEAIHKIDAHEVVIDGVRNVEEVAAFREALGHDFVLVAIHASPNTRLERILARKRPDDAPDEATFRARDARELGWGIGSVIALADIMLVNEASQASIREAALRILRM